MAESILAATLTVFAVLCLFQRASARRFVAYIVVVSELSHYFLFNDYAGLLYYGSAALFDLFAIMLIAKVAIPTALASQMLAIYAASIALNYAGFVLWLTYMPPTLYNFGFIILNLLTIICLIKREPGHGRQDAGDSGDSILYRYSYFSR